MARNYAHVDEGDRARRATWQLGWRAWLAWSVCGFAGWLIWRTAIAFPPGWPVRVSGLVVAVPSSALFAIAVEKGLTYTPLSRAWRYRLAFLLGGAPVWFAWSFTGKLSALAMIASLGLTGTASFLGSILATFLEDGVWENNSPPSERTSLAVYQRHLVAPAKPMPEPRDKRIFDLVLAASGLVLSLPIWVLSIFLIWIEDPGPILFVKNSVGKSGRNFHQFKFRTMVRQAEGTTGPILASVGDQRVLRIGRLLRKTALDELPQLLNILAGEMSFVGPRPQRTVLVEQYLERIPEYAERHRVLPGLAGLAQVAGDYYLSPRQKLRFDRIYIQYRSLAFDLKLLVLAFLIAFWFRWKKGWNGRIPRSLIRFPRY